MLIGARIACYYKKARVPVVQRVRSRSPHRTTIINRATIATHRQYLQFHRLALIRVEGSPNYVGISQKLGRINGSRPFNAETKNSLYMSKRRLGALGVLYGLGIIQSSNHILHAGPAILPLMDAA